MKQIRDYLYTINETHQKNENEKGFHYGRFFLFYGSYYGHYSTLSDSEREFLEV